MRILITGVSTRALAWSALQAGYDFVTLDYFGDYDQRSWCENYSLKRDFNLAYGPARLVEASRHLRYDALVYTAGLENHPAAVAQLAAGATGTRPALLGNRPAVLARVRNWPIFFAFLRSQGVPAPQTFVDREVPGSDPRRRWLRKPVDSGGGHGITFWSGGRAPGAGFLLQEHLAGRACSVAFVANGHDAVVLGLTEQMIGRPEFGGNGFTYSGNIFPLPPGADTAGVDVLADVSVIVSALSREFGLVGLNGLDFVLAGGHACPLELNPRYCASMELIELADGRSLFGSHLAAVSEGSLPAAGKSWPDPATGYYGKAILYAERDCRTQDTRSWPERGIRDVPFPGEEIAQGSPVCTILAQGATVAACYESLVTQAEALKRELYA